MDRDALEQWRKEGYKDGEHLNASPLPSVRDACAEVTASLNKITALKKGERPVAQIGYNIGLDQRVKNDWIAAHGEHPDDEVLAQLNHRLATYEEYLLDIGEHYWLSGPVLSTESATVKFNRAMDKASVARMMADPTMASVHMNKRAGTLSGMLYGGDGLLGMVAPNLYGENLPSASKSQETTVEPAAEGQGTGESGEAANGQTQGQVVQQAA